jgi:segregation and condensation protein A
MTQPYRVRLEEFEGPLDLLLFFIKRDELDIQDIPIARITREFLDALHLMQQLDLEVAGEFIVMAAELMQIKVRMLLPREEGEEEETDPRAELVRRLVEYKRFKEKALEMSSMEDEQRRLYYRRFFTGDPVARLDDGEDEGMKEITLFNLITAFRRAMDQMPRKVIHEVQMPNVSVDEQMSFTLDYLRVHGSARLLSMVSHMTEKIRVIVTIIALLEMAKNRVITLAPADGGEDILIESTGATAVVIPATPR